MNRRQFLTVGSTVATAGLAGCTDILGGDDGAGLDDVGAWLPDPVAIDSGLDHYAFEARSPAAQAEAVDDLFVESSFRPDPEFGSVTVTDVESTISVSNASTAQSQYSFDLYFGSFDADWAETNLQNNGYNRVGSNDDLTIYDRNDTAAIAVSSDTAIEVTHQGSNPDAARLIDTLIDTEAGEVDRYTDAYSDMEVLLDSLPSGHNVEGEAFSEVSENAPEVGLFEGQVAGGTSETIDGRQVDVTEVLVFLDDRDVVERRIEEYIDESGEFRDFLSRPDYEIDGRSVTISGTSTF